MDPFLAMRTVDIMVSLIILGKPIYRWSFIELGIPNHDGDDVDRLNLITHL